MFAWEAKEKNILVITHVRGIFVCSAENRVITHVSFLIVGREIKPEI